MRRRSDERLPSDRRGARIHDPSTTDRHPNGGFGCPTTAARGSGGWWWPIETCQLPLRGAWYSLGGRHPWNVACYVSDGASLVSAPKWGRSRWSLPAHTIRISLPCPSWSRSDEHTSELPSLMRHSYAVFCFKTTHINIMSTTASI